MVVVPNLRWLSLNVGGTLQNITPDVTSCILAVTEIDIHLDLVSDTEWRVRDRRLPTSNHRAILGVISRTPDGYEAMSINDPVKASNHSSLASATATFCDPQSNLACQ